MAGFSNGDSSIPPPPPDTLAPPRPQVQVPHRLPATYHLLLQLIVFLGPQRSPRRRKRQDGEPLEIVDH